MRILFGIKVTKIKINQIRTVTKIRRNQKNWSGVPFKAESINVQMPSAPLKNPTPTWLPEAQEKSIRLKL